jgi:hypothetical protein
MGAKTSLHSLLYACSRKGERAHCAVPRNRGKNTTLLSSMSLKGMRPSLAIEEAFSKMKMDSAQGGGQMLRGTDRSDEQGTRRDHVSGCERLLQALRIPSTGSTVLIAAVDA